MSRRFFQFSLRSLLTFTTLIAIATWWFLSPKPPEFRLSSGVCVRGVTEFKGVFVPHGNFQACDANGQLTYRGEFRNGSAEGKCRGYHPNGQLACAGESRRGHPFGPWRFWDERGRLLVEAQFGEPRPRREVEHLTRPSLNGLWKTLWANGKLRERGWIEAGRRRGQWYFFDETGRPLAVGLFEDGRREGLWQQDGPGPLQHVFYVAGRPLPLNVNPAEATKREVVRLVRRLESPFAATASSAARELARVGVPAVRRLAAKLDDTADPAVQVLILETLADIGPPASEVLGSVQSLLRDDNEHVRDAAWLAFFALDPTDSETALQLVTRATTGDARTRSAWVPRLARIGPTFTQHLEKRLKSPATISDAERYLYLAVLSAMLSEELRRDGEIHWLLELAGRLENPQDPDSHAVVRCLRETAENRGKSVR